MSGNSSLRTRNGDGSEIFNVKDDRHLEYQISQPVTDEASKSSAG